MATAKPPLSTPPRRRRRRIVLAALVLAVLALAWFWRPLNSHAVTGASYGARIACSCRFIAGRSLSDCRKDFEPGMALVTLNEDEAEKSVTARFPLLSSQTATFRQGEGCVPEKWAD